RRCHLPGPPSADASTARRKAFVVAHDELRFHLVNGIHGNADHDQQRGAAEVEVEAEAVRNPERQVLEESSDEREVVQMNTADEQLRNDGDNDQVESAHQRDARQDVVDEVRSTLAGTNAGDKSAVLAHVVGNVVGTEDDGDV